MLLVGVPSIFPERGGVAQMFWGLMVCFVTSSAYAQLSPFAEASDDVLAQLAQLQIFLTLLSALALRTTPPSALAGFMVTFVLFAVPIIGVALETPLFKAVGAAWAKVKGRVAGLFAHLKPPALELTSTRAPSPSSADDTGTVASGTDTKFMA